MEEIDHIETFQQYILDLQQRKMEKEKAKQDERKMMEEFFEGNKTLAILLVHIPVGEQQHQIRFWHVEQIEFLSAIGDDRVEGMTYQLELFSIAMGKRWMDGLGVVANHSTVVVEEKEKEKQMKRKL